MLVNDAESIQLGEQSGGNLEGSVHQPSLSIAKSIQTFLRGENRDTVLARFRAISLPHKFLTKRVHLILLVHRQSLDCARIDRSITFPGANSIPFEIVERW